MPAPSLEGRVLVTGGTGFLGQPLVGRLTGCGARVRVLARSATRAKRLALEGVEAVVGDVGDRTVVEAALADVAVVYHLAGRLMIPGEPAAEYRRTHVDGTRLLLAACRRKGIERFVHCSTTGVLGHTGDRPADEAAPLRPTNVYEATKAEAELGVRAACREGFPGVIVRPGLVYGPGDLHLLAFFRSILRRQFRPIGRRPIWLHPIYVDDMTDALLQCGVQEAALGECFNIAGREPVPLAALAATIARAAGTSLPRGCIPLRPARFAAAVGDMLPGSLRTRAPLTRSRLDFLTHSRTYDVEKSRRLLGFVGATDLPTGIACSVAWYRREGLLPAGSSS